jgi:hypothetical protein
VYDESFVVLCRALEGKRLIWTTAGGEMTDATASGNERIDL